LLRKRLSSLYPRVLVPPDYFRQLPSNV
jgi:hypothetical protein